MIINLKSDSHIHTSLCGHAFGTMEEFVRAGIAAGLTEMFFLEHLEIGINYFEKTWLSEEDFDEYFREGRRLREKFADRIRIGLGVEVGYNPDEKQAILNVLAARNFDRVAVSYHFMKAGDRHLNLVSRKHDNIEGLGRLGVAKVLTAYFETLQEAIGTVPAEMVCHLDAAMRYHPEIKLEASHHRQIEKILDLMAKKGVALEVNFSGCRMRGVVFPEPEIIRKAVKKGITLLAGSDAHVPEHVGQFIGFP
ncbi:MAG: histidinol-phosphatase HisJ family protein [Proteobacteria bacterium]|nr:histidinol-phosphatase HisJ family protein [Pseudomonadota bacterium]MBU1736746.1 histidinol-phosphatase HisJ family protein [Pseudomonadota bacterium]